MASSGSSSQSSSSKVLDTLSLHAQNQPTKRAWVFVNDDGQVVDSYTYAELEAVSDGLANHLIKNCKIGAGERAVLVFFPGLLFSVSLLACFKAGIIAVPVFPPDPRRLKKDLEHFVSIQSSCGAKVALTHSPYDYAKKLAGIKSMFASGGASWPEMTWITVDDIAAKIKAIHAKSSSPLSSPTVRREGKIAFLQYTSGSTSEPKGVMISHENLAHNLLIITRELAVNQSTINVSWLPQYHDMGLIGSYLGCLYCGGTGIYMSPISFLKDPTIWLDTISKFRGTHTQAPNFAFALVCRKFKESGKLQRSTSASSGPPGSELDLSCIQHMINAAEPVDADAIADFYTTFRPFGLPDHVVVPTYGLAEHTVFVCSAGKTLLHVNKQSLEQGTVEVIGEALLGQDVPTRAGEGLQAIVGCGIPEKAEAVEVIIVDPETRMRVEDEKVGEIWVDSPSKANGYWDKPEISNEVFHASLASDGSSQPSKGYLRSGDLGFMRRGELFICGRLKDLIIVRGANHYPQDIERTAEKCGSELLRAGCSAAFAVPHEAGGTEVVVYVAEVKPGVSQREFPALVDSLRTIIAKEHGLGLASICLLEPRTIEKTTSGKIARAWCRRAYLKGSMKVVHRWDGNPLEVEAEVARAGSDGAVLVPGEGDALLGTPSPSGAAAGGSGGGLGAALTAEELRALPKEEIGIKLEKALVAVSSNGSSPLSPPINPDLSLLSLGLDSMTIVQFKGLLEKRFHCSVPDEFLFTEMCTISQLIIAVQHGMLSTDQKTIFDSHLAAHPPASADGANGVDSDGNTRSTMIDVRVQRQPCCPWFTCCY